MSINFSLLKAVKRLEERLTADRQYLDTLVTTDDSVIRQIESYNSYVFIFNDLMSSLSNTSESLFSPYTRTMNVVVDAESGLSDAPMVMESKPESKPEWEVAGFLSREDWMIHKDAQSSSIVNDNQLNKQFVESKERVSGLIATHNQTESILNEAPEDYPPTDVIPKDNAEYLTHTAEHVRLDNDNPTQIAEVLTATESQPLEQSAILNLDEYRSSDRSLLIPNLIDSSELQNIKVSTNE